MCEAAYRFWKKSVIFTFLSLFKAILDLILEKSENLMFLGKYQKSVSKSRKYFVPGHPELKGGGGGGGGVQAYHFGKKDFELGVGGEGQDTSRHFEGSFGSYVQYCPCEASVKKLVQKRKSKLKDIELTYCHHSICV